VDRIHHFNHKFKIINVCVWGITVDVRYLSYDVIQKMYDRYQEKISVSIKSLKYNPDLSFNNIKQYIESKRYYSDFESFVNLNLCCTKRGLYLYYIGKGDDYFSNSQTKLEFKNEISNELRQLGLDGSSLTFINEVWIEEEGIH
jgi:hypothetical protein